MPIASFIFISFRQPDAFASSSFHLPSRLCFFRYFRRERRCPSPRHFISTATTPLSASFIFDIFFAMPDFSDYANIFIFEIFQRFSC